MTIRRNIIYGVRGGRHLQGDLFVPSSASAGTPGLLLVVHGGGWEDCTNRRSATDGAAAVLAHSTGAVAFNLEYRLRQEGGGFPENVMDVRCAVQHLVGRADELGYDGGRVAMIGSSAGAHLTLMTALTRDREDFDPACGPSSALDLAVAYSAPADLPAMGDDGSVATGTVALYTRSDCAVPVRGCTAARACDICVDASPLAHACSAAGEIILVSAPEGYDLITPHAQSLRLHQALLAAGAESTLWVPTPAEIESSGCVRPTSAADIPQSAHGFTPCLIDPTAERLVQRLVDTVGPR